MVRGLEESFSPKGFTCLRRERDERKINREEKEREREPQNEKEITGKGMKKEDRIGNMQKNKKEIYLQIDPITVHFLCNGSLRILSTE